MTRIAFLGTGAMGEALARGWLSSGVAQAADLTLFDVAQDRVRSLAESLGARAAASPLEAVENADVVLLAVKPQVVESALAPLRSVFQPSQLLVSIAAGVSTQKLEALFDHSVPVMRVMPNTPALVGAAASALCRGTHASDEQLQTARKLFGAVGVAVEIEEKLLDGVTGLSGSGPAYVFAFIEALADGGVRSGLPRDVAQKLAAQTVLGAAKMVLEGGEHPGVLKDRVASPGGTTIAGLHALERGGFRGVVMDAVVEAAERSSELG